MNHITSKLIAFMSIWLFFSPFSLAIAEENILWKAVSKGEVVAIMRHALAPGTGDPSNFDLRNCNTQRNLSDRGHKQAEEIGRIFKENAIENAYLYSSEWCRCLETAEGLDMGEVKALPIINSFFRDRSTAETQTIALNRWLYNNKGKGPTILVTHQVNITALTDIFPESGEIIFVKPISETQAEIIARLKTL